MHICPHELLIIGPIVVGVRFGWYWLRARLGA